MLLLLFSLALLTPGIAGCSTDEDCFLNGVCGQDGSCVCDPWWTSKNCSLLALEPAPLPVSFHGRNGTKTTSWGGSVLHDPKSKQFFMYAAEMINDCPLGDWQRNSEVVVASAKTATGPYTYLSQVTPPWAHNPEAIKIGDDIIVYSLGDGVPIHGAPKDCSSSSSSGDRFPEFPETSSPPSNNNRTVHFVVRHATSFAGPFHPVNLSIVDFPSNYRFPSNWNPAPYAMPDGSVRLMVHTNTAPWAGEVIVEAPTWRGPYTPITKDITNCTRCQEDPFMWKDARGNWHVLYHKMFDPAGSSPIPSPGWAGGHSFSEDGISWSPISRAYNTSMVLSDGTSLELKRRERPKLIFDSDGVTPTHLSNGAVGPDGSTYTIVVPLRQK